MGIYRCRETKCIETNVIYESIKDAANAVGGRGKTLSNCCMGKRETYKGFHWEFTGKIVEKIPQRKGNVPKGEDWEKLEMVLVEKGNHFEVFKRVGEEYINLKLVLVSGEKAAKANYWVSYNVANKEFSQMKDFLELSNENQNFTRSFFNMESVPCQN